MLVLRTVWADTRFAAWKQGAWVPAALQRVVDDLQSYYQRPIDEIAARYWQSREDAPDPGGVLEHYQSTEQYIYESGMFEALAEYQRDFYADFRQFDRLMAERGLAYRGRIRPDPVSEWLCKRGRRMRIWRVWLDRKPKFGGRFTVHEKPSSAS